MKRTFLMVVSMSATAFAFFLVGFFLGRNSVETNVYDAAISGAESPLLGRWHISSNVEPKQSIIEFRRDRTAVKYLDNDSVGMVANWGRIQDQLTLQNAHVPGEQGEYVPPAIFNVVKSEGDHLHLQACDEQIEWELSRL